MYCYNNTNNTLSNNCYNVCDLQLCVRTLSRRPDNASKQIVLSLMMRGILAYLLTMKTENSLEEISTELTANPNRNRIHLFNIGDVDENVVFVSIQNALMQEWDNNVGVQHLMRLYKKYVVIDDRDEFTTEYIDRHMNDAVVQLLEHRNNIQEFLTIIYASIPDCIDLVRVEGVRHIRELDDQEQDIHRENRKLDIAVNLRRHNLVHPEYLRQTRIQSFGECKRGDADT